MAMEPAAISAIPANTTTLLVAIAERPAAKANGTVNPSDMPMTMSRTVAEAVKCFSICGVVGIRYLLDEIFRKYTAYAIYNGKSCSSQTLIKIYINLH